MHTYTNQGNVLTRAAAATDLLRGSPVGIERCHPTGQGDSRRAVLGEPHRPPPSVQADRHPVGKSRYGPHRFPETGFVKLITRRGIRHPDRTVAMSRGDAQAGKRHREARFKTCGESAGSYLLFGVRVPERVSTVPADHRQKGSFRGRVGGDAAQLLRGALQPPHLTSGLRVPQQGDTISAGCQPQLAAGGVPGREIDSRALVADQ